MMTVGNAVSACSEPAEGQTAGPTGTIRIGVIAPQDVFRSLSGGRRLPCSASWHAVAAPFHGVLDVDVLLFEPCTLVSCGTTLATLVGKIPRGSKGMLLIAYVLPTQASLRATLRLSRSFPFELCIAGVDDLHQLLANWSHGQPDSNAAAETQQRLPIAWQPVLSQVRDDPAAWTPKRISSTLRVSRRTLDRTFIGAGQLTVHAWLTDIRLVLLRALLGQGAVKLGELPGLCGWRDVRGLLRWMKSCRRAAPREDGTVSGEWISR
jgi:AraC-like DNA-binding protein